MSCVVGINDNGTIYMGADSAATNELELRSFGDKIFQNRSVMIGFCGFIRPGQTLSPGQWTPPKAIEEFPDSLREIFDRKGCLRIVEGIELTDCEFMFGYKKKLFEIGADFHISFPKENYSAIGSGKYYALGSLYETSKTEMSPEDRIIEALECASYFSPTVRGPFTVFSTKR